MRRPLRPKAMDERRRQDERRGGRDERRSRRRRDRDRHQDRSGQRGEEGKDGEVLREKDNSPAVEIGDHTQLRSYKSEHWEALTQEIELLIANFVKEEKKREGCRIAQEEKEADEKEEKM